MASTAKDFDLNGHSMEEWDSLVELLDRHTRREIFDDAINNGKNSLSDFLSLGVTMETRLLAKRYQEKCNVGFKSLAGNVLAHPVFLSITHDENFKRACTEFRRLKNRGQPNYGDPFSELRFAACFVGGLNLHYLMQVSKKPPKYASAKTKEKGRAAAKKLLALMTQERLKLRDYSEQAALQRGLTKLILEIDSKVRSRRVDETTKHRESVEIFVRFYKSDFGHISPSVTRSFAAMIAYDVTPETLKEQIKKIAAVAAFKAETVFFEGGGINVEILPFSTVGILPTK